MKNNTIIILIVDDDPLQAEVHTIFLEEAGYETMYAENGADALEILHQTNAAINVILSDVVMPEMDGYELCRQVKSDETLKELPFIFVSALTDVEEKIKGYSVGGDDYVSKPISTDELLEKVKSAVKRHEINKSKNSTIQESYNAAMQAMTYSSDLGQIIEFYKNSLNADSFEDLSQQLFQVMASYGLRSTLYIQTPTAAITIGDAGDVSPLEENIIELARKQDRFWDFGTRTIINYADFSLFVKNMPVNDPERFGTLKDSLGSLCNAIEACIKILLFDDTNKQKAHVLETVRETLSNVSGSFREIQKENLQSIQTMTDKLDDALMNMGLTDHQENLIRDIAVSCYEEVDGIFEKGLVLNDEFASLDERLTKIFSS
jgi:DNA-binding response OmpR family regulator